MIGGRSANRGTCAQACRLPYELHNRALQKDLPSPGEHLLSPQDLCTIDLMEELVDVGVSSLKIEGRMKSPEYVSAVVSVYRKQLDYVLAQRAAAEGAEAEDTEAEDTEAESLEGESADGAGADRTSAGCEGVQVEAAGGEGAEGEAADGEGVECEGAEVADAEGAIFEPVNDTDRARLTEAFSRGFTTAYLEGNRGNSMMSYQRPNNRGLFLGRVAEIKNGAALLKPTQELSVGDVLEFWTRKGNGVLTLSAVEQASKGLVRIPLDAKTRMVKAGDRVFRVRSAAAAFEDDAREPRVPVFGHATLKLGEPLSIEFALDPQSRAGRRLAPLFPEGLPTGFAQGVEVEAARTRAVSAEDAAAHIDRLGSTPFVLAGLTLDIDEGIGVGFSALHKVRAKALEALEAALLTARQMRKLPRVAPKDSLPAVHPSGCKIAVTVTNPACARAAKRAGAHLIYVPALNYRRGEAVIAGQLNAGAEQAGYPKGCIPIIPVVNHEEVGSAREAQVSAEVWKYVSAGKPFMAESLASLQRGSEEEAIIEVGPHLPLTNKLGLETACEFGARRVWLSPELNLKQLEELACDAPVDLGVLLIGAQELMVTEHCMLMSQGPCDEECAVCSRRKSPHYLKDRKGYEFPVITDAMGRSHMYNAVELDIASAMPELLAAGISSYMIDATLMNVEQTAQAVGRALRALHVAQNDGNAIAKMPNTTAGHLYRGVS
jgi:putative protease